MTTTIRLRRTPLHAKNDLIAYDEVTVIKPFGESVTAHMGTELWLSSRGRRVTYLRLAQMSTDFKGCTGFRIEEAVKRALEELVYCERCRRRGKPKLIGVTTYGCPSCRRELFDDMHEAVLP